MIEQITLQQRAEFLNVNCFSPTVIFSQGAPSNIANSDSAVIVSATGLATLDFAFSKTRRWRFLGWWTYRGPRNCTNNSTE